MAEKPKPSRAVDPAAWLDNPTGSKAATLGARMLGGEWVTRDDAVALGGVTSLLHSVVKRLKTHGYRVETKPAGPAGLTASPGPARSERTGRPDGAAGQGSRQIRHADERDLSGPRFDLDRPGLVVGRRRPVGHPFVQRDRRRVDGVDYGTRRVTDPHGTAASPAAAGAACRLKISNRPKDSDVAWCPYCDRQVFSP